MIGQPAEPDTSFREAKLEARFAIDTLDHYNFPSSGLLGKLQWNSAHQWLGSDENFDQGEFQLTGVTSFHRHRLFLKTRIGYTLNDDAPLQAQFTLGGFGNLSGMQPNQLYGQNVGLLSAAYYRRMADLVVLPLYLGATLEAGNVWQDNADFGQNPILAGSLFLGLDTFIGPLFFGFGHAEGGFNSAFIHIGEPLHRAGAIAY